MSILSNSRKTVVAALAFGTFVILTLLPSLAADRLQSGQRDPNRGDSLSRPTVKVHSIAAGRNHSLAIAADGTVWAWYLGWPLGSGAPAQVPELSDVVMVDAGRPNLALLRDGTFREFDAQIVARPSPMTGIVSVVAGDGPNDPYRADGTLLRADGTVWEYWKDGSVSMVSGFTGVVAVARLNGWWNDFWLVLKGDGTVWQWPSGVIEETSPAQVPGLTRIVAIAVGSYVEGSPYDESFGQVHCLAVKDDGTVWAWGSNAEGQLGDGTTTRRTAPVQVPGFSGVVAVAAGERHSLALKDDGTVWAWGGNQYGQLGDGTVTTRLSPVLVTGTGGVVQISVREDHNLALVKDGSVWEWGGNSDDQLSDGTTPVRVAGLPPILQAPTVDAIVNAASFQSRPVAPGEIVSVFGDEIGPLESVIGSPDADGILPKILGRTRVLFAGVEAPLLFAQRNQVSAIVPYGLEGGTAAQFQVEYRGATSRPKTIAVTESAPGIFSMAVSGSGQGVILNEDGTLNSTSTPARRGSVVAVFATGEGQTSPSGTDGKIAADLQPRPLLPVAVQIGGREAQVLEASSAPNLAGVLLVRARIPEIVAPGPSVPIILVVGTERSQTSVTLAVR